MAKIVGPLLSTEAHGTIGERLTFSKRKTGQQVRFQKAQIPDPLSFGQADTKSLYRVIYARWLSLSAGEKEGYNDLAKLEDDPMSGWNYFVKVATADPKTYLGLVGYWSMNRLAFATILDLSKNGNVGTLKPTYPSNCPAYVASQNTKMFNALSFDGVDDYVNCGNGASLAVTTNFTIEMWVKMGTQTQDYARALEKGRWTADYSRYGYRFYTAQPAASAIRLAFETMGGGNSDTVFFSSTSMMGTWYHIVATYQSGVTNGMKAYKNGVLFSQKTPTVVMSTDIDPLVIGSYSGGLGSNFNGLIDEVRIYNRALSAGEILSLYNMFK